MLVFIKVKVALGLLVFGAKHAVGRGELGHDQAAAAQIANEAAKHCIGDPSHGSEHRGRRNSARTRSAANEGQGAALRWPGRQKLAGFSQNFFTRCIVTARYH